MTFCTYVSFILYHSISPRRSNCNLFSPDCMRTESLQTVISVYLPVHRSYIIQNVTIMLELFTFSFCKIMMKLVANAMIIKK